MIESAGLSFFEPIKILFVALLIYALMFAMLKKIGIFDGHEGVNAIIALLATIIVSFSGVVTYAVSYAINWFVIIIFIVFLMMVLMLFLGVKPGDIASQVTKNGKVIMIVFFILFSIILVKSFFAINNTFDNNEPQNNSYNVDTSFNTGVDDVTNKDLNKNFWDNIDSDLLSSVIFLIVLGGFVMLIG